MGPRSTEVQTLWLQATEPGLDYFQEVGTLSKGFWVAHRSKVKNGKKMLPKKNQRLLGDVGNRQ